MALALVPWSVLVLVVGGVKAFELSCCRDLLTKLFPVGSLIRINSPTSGLRCWVLVGWVEFELNRQGGFYPGSQGFPSSKKVYIFIQFWKFIRVITVLMELLLSIII